MKKPIFFLVPLASFIVTVLFTLNINCLWHCQTKFQFGIHNLFMGMLRFPVLMPVGHQSYLSFSLCGSLSMYLLVITSIHFRNGELVAFGISFFRFLGFILLVAVSDYSYQYMESINHFKTLGLTLLLLNVVTYLTTFLAKTSLNN